MVTRQYRRPYLRSPYIREQLEQPKQQLSGAIELIEDLLDGVGGAFFALKQLTEQSAEATSSETAERRQLRTEGERDV